MAKNTDLFVAQHALIKGWVSPKQISHCMSPKPYLPLGERLVQEGYLQPEQHQFLQREWHSRKVGKEVLMACPTCREHIAVADYQPGEEYECPKCQTPLLSPKTTTIRTRTSRSKKEEHAPQPASEGNAPVGLPSVHDENAPQTLAQSADAPAAELAEFAAEAGSLVLEDPLLTNRFADYAVLEELGRGGMGIVYKVQYPGVDTPLALKMLLRNDESSDSLARFYREIDLASKLRHPNIVGIHDVGAYNGIPYYTMDYIAGEPLDSYLIKQGHLGETQAVEIMEKVTMAIAAAHKANIVHRDLKPENILLDEHLKPYVMDFGIAKSYEKQFKRLTRTGLIMGTPEYMSPEQARGQTHAIGFASDIYSLGATLYHLLTGQVPFSGQTPIEVITNVVQGELIPPRAVAPEISKKAEAIVLKAMVKNPAHRYTSAAAMAFDLRSLLAGKPIMARQRAWYDSLWAYLARNWVAVLCFLISFFAILLMLSSVFSF